MTIVDNNVLSAVAKIERLALFPAVFDSVATPPAVVAELDRAKTAGYEFVDRVDFIKSYNNGWLNIVSPTQSELRLADEIRDHALSTTDAQCIAIAQHRTRRLVTDDAHVGTIASQRDVDVWDLTLFLEAAIEVDEIETADDISKVIDDLRRNDGYRFAAADEDYLFDRF